MGAILSKFTVLGLSSYFVVYFLKSKLILFYNRIVYTRIFLILLPYSVYVYIIKDCQGICSSVESKWFLWMIIINTVKRHLFFPYSNMSNL